MKNLNIKDGQRVLVQKQALLRGCGERGANKDA